MQIMLNAMKIAELNLDCLILKINAFCEKCCLDKSGLFVVQRENILRQLFTQDLLDTSK